MRLHDKAALRKRYQERQNARSSRTQTLSRPTTTQSTAIQLSQMLKSAATLISASARGRRGFRIRDKQRWTLRGNRTSLRNPTIGFILANDFAQPKYI